MAYVGATVQSITINFASTYRLVVAQSNGRTVDSVATITFIHNCDNKEKEAGNNTCEEAREFAARSQAVIPQW